MILFLKPHSAFEAAAVLFSFLLKLMFCPASSVWSQTFSTSSSFAVGKHCISKCNLASKDSFGHKILMCTLLTCASRFPLSSFCFNSQGQMWWHNQIWHIYCIDAVNLQFQPSIHVVHSMMRNPVICTKRKIYRN